MFNLQEFFFRFYSKHKCNCCCYFRNGIAFLEEVCNDSRNENRGNKEDS